ncbi:phytanoyl-CoA dioxygenase family protein [Kibdelosporangium aridum]|uniref:Ectoine hydroxylase-related dioxygenase, phytanoyl-CoA dioxygenase (PhyH) family n=1 Tax=Kibdelosporangium aridum TaxID=2030 RepID=A0A1W2FVE8_KIBAR|nr:phytanoyl-CoA dioxygenase family protein [Kibdelosporangium aridum]SMD25890.1 Ectoine hydroxylase-related dioxygenase, phytanoyl-CoA dioxygenase (PhyH) family [Kibdelosporangium aridum]
MTAQATEGLTTPDTLSDDLITYYRTNGFVHVPNVLSAEEVAEFRAEAQRQLKASEKLTWDMGGGDIAMDWVPDANKHGEILRRLTMHPSVAGIAERLAGGPLRMFKSELLRKAGNKTNTGTPHHDDQSILPFHSDPPALTAWVPLVDVPLARGPMSYIPGSHRRPEPVPLDDEVANLRPLDYWSELNYQPMTTKPARVGDVCYHTDRVVHSATVNETDTDRIVLATIYMSAYARYRHNPFYSGTYLDDPDLGGMKPGELLASRDERFPLVGSKA